jgi:hypothetical protein
MLLLKCAAYEATDTTSSENRQSLGKNIRECKPRRLQIFPSFLTNLKPATHQGSIRNGGRRRFFIQAYEFPGVGMHTSCSEGTEGSRNDRPCTSIDGDEKRISFRRLFQLANSPALDEPAVVVYQAKANSQLQAPLSKTGQPDNRHEAKGVSSSRVRAAAS